MPSSVALPRIASPFTVVLVVGVVTVFVAQALGSWLWRRQRPRASASPV